MAELRNGNFRFPDSAINYGNSPLPLIPPNAAQFKSADGQYRDSNALLPGRLYHPYAYGQAARISTQTQMAFPNRVQLIIPALYIPAPQSDGLSKSDPILEHAISDGDLVFAFRMGMNMAGYGSNYYKAPYGHTAKAVKLVNLATLNYILWGLQIGKTLSKPIRWELFFKALTEKGYKQIMDGCSSKGDIKESTVWNFIKTYLRPLGVQHGGDQQGGMHQGDSNRIVTHGAVDYVSSFAIEGKLLHVNNLWRDHDVHENDDLVLALRYIDYPHADLQFNLSSSVRSQRTENVPIPKRFYFLCPEILQYRSFSDVPYIHIGRSQKYCSLYARGHNACCWDARIPVIPGAPLQMTFEPVFMDSDAMFYKSWDINDKGNQDSEGDDENRDDNYEDNNEDDENEEKTSRITENEDLDDDNLHPKHGLRFTNASFFSSASSSQPIAATTAAFMMTDANDYAATQLQNMIKGRDGDHHDNNNNSTSILTVEKEDTVEASNKTNDASPQLGQVGGGVLKHPQQTKLQKSQKRARTSVLAMLSSSSSEPPAANESISSVMMESVQD